MKSENKNIEQDVRQIFKQKIDMCLELKKVSKDEQRQQILPTLQEAIDRKKGQLTLF
jgi:hypothetical protein